MIYEAAKTPWVTVYFDAIRLESLPIQDEPGEGIGF
jgi:hypothetical protein